MALEGIVCAGDRLGPGHQYAGGTGTYTRNGYVYAAIVGQCQERPNPDASSAPQASTSAPAHIIDIVRRGSRPVIPASGDLVTVKVTRVTPMLANTLIKCVGNQPVDVEFRGVIRLADVRATEIDKVQIHESFRPGDIVRARVVSLGDARSYYLSTAANDLGVVHARSAGAGLPMTPISWSEMQCPETLAVEKRKVAQTEPVAAPVAVAAG